MGMAGGAYKADKERAQLALQARQIANQSTQARQNAILRQKEIDLRKQAREDSIAMHNRELEVRDRQRGFENDLRQKQLDANIEHQRRVDDIALRAAERADALLQQRLAKQSQVYSGYEKMAKQARAQQEERQALGASAVASVMKLALKSGGKNEKGELQKGMVPMYALQALNRDMGFDGENQGFVSGGYTSNGDFFLQFAQKDPQSGQIVTRPQVISPIDQYRIMHQQQGIFDNSDRGSMAAQLKKTGFRDDEILLASGINQTQLEQMRKLATAKQTQDTTLKDRMAGLSMIKDFLDKTADLDEATEKSLRGAYQNGIMQIASQYAPKAPEPGKNAPMMNEDGTLTLPNGTTLRKDQEYTNPQDGKKYIWRGGDPKNFEAMAGGDNGSGAQGGENGLQKYGDQGKGRDTMTDSEFSARRAHQAQYYGKVQPGYEMEGDDTAGGENTEETNPAAVEQPTPTKGGGMAGGAAGGAGGAAHAGGGDEAKVMYDRLKSRGLIDKDMSLEDFTRQFNEENEPEEEMQQTGGEME